VSFAGGQIIERSADGETAVWGTVNRWEPPDAVAFSWHPGQSAERASQVLVTFARPASRRWSGWSNAGWEAFADPAAARAEYDHGWPLVLDRYAGHLAGRGADVDGDGGEDTRVAHTRVAHTWVALLHRPGPESAARQLGVSMIRASASTSPSWLGCTRRATW